MRVGRNSVLHYTGQSLCEFRIDIFFPLDDRVRPAAGMPPIATSQRRISVWNEPLGIVLPQHRYGHREGGHLDAVHHE